MSAGALFSPTANAEEKEEDFVVVFKRCFDNPTDGKMYCVWVFAIVFISFGTKFFMEVGDITEWREGRCQPLYETRGGSCCIRAESDSQCIKDDYQSEQWTRVTSSCSGKSIDMIQLDEICTNPDREGRWPSDTYSPSFLSQNSTKFCWTNCENYVWKDPTTRYILALSLTVTGYGMLEISVICASCYWSRGWVGLQFWMFYHIVIFWISISNCTFHLSCHGIEGGYIMVWMTPLVLLCLGICHPLFDLIMFVDNVEKCIFDCWQAWVHISALVLGISALVTKEPERCFKVYWCQFHMYILCIVLAIYWIFFINYYLKPILLRFKTRLCDSLEERKRKNEELRTKVLFLQSIDKRWQGQKDLIMPYIDDRDHIWNEIWTMSWEMEKEFSNSKNSNHLKLKEYSDFYQLRDDDFGEYYESYQALNLEFDFCVQIKKSICDRTIEISLESIAASKGNINFNTYYSDNAILEHVTESVMDFFRHAKGGKNVIPAGVPGRKQLELEQALTLVDNLETQPTFI